MLQVVRKGNHWHINGLCDIQGSASWTRAHRIRDWTINLSHKYTLNDLCSLNRGKRCILCFNKNETCYSWLWSGWFYWQFNTLQQLGDVFWLDGWVINQQARKPPSTGRVTPLVMLLLSLSRNKILLTTSSTSADTHTQRVQCIKLETYMLYCRQFVKPGYFELHSTLAALVTAGEIHGTHRGVTSSTQSLWSPSYVSMFIEQKSPCVSSSDSDNPYSTLE